MAGLVISKAYQRIAKSSLNIVRIKVEGEEPLVINITRELTIRERTIQSHIQVQPALYATLSVMHRKAIAAFERLELLEQRVLGKLFKEYKTDRESEYFKENHKLPSDDLCNHMALSDRRYTSVANQKIDAKEDMLILGSLVKSFEQKADLLQTISANYRRERNI